MIIGKSLTALGGGGLKPEIRVTAQAGALLNLHYKDSSIILQSYQLGAEETQHTFVVDVSETAYVAEDVTNGASVEVLVDTIAQYSVEMDYKLWLYRDGDECTDVTGGWSYYSTNSDSVNAVTLNATNIALEPYPAGKNTGVTMNKYVDVTNYTKAYFEFKRTNTLSSTNNYWTFSIVDSSGEGVTSVPTNDGIISVDISALAGFRTVKVWLYSMYIKITKIWLE